MIKSRTSWHSPLLMLRLLTKRFYSIFSVGLSDNFSGIVTGEVSIRDNITHKKRNRFGDNG